MLYANLCANSADKKNDFFSYFIPPRKQDLTFHANCNGDNLHEISKLETICMKSQNLFSGENKKKYFSMSSAEN